MVFDFFCLVGTNRSFMYYIIYDQKDSYETCRIIKRY